MYEPLWEDLHARSKKSGFKIRSIWIADVAHQGQSGVLNEALLGDDRKSRSVLTLFIDDFSLIS